MRFFSTDLKRSTITIQLPETTAYIQLQDPVGIANNQAEFFSLDSVAPCGATLSGTIHGFFLYVTHLLIFSKRVRGEMSFQRGATIMA